jgi:hypothetical protein
MEFKRSAIVTSSPLAGPNKPAGFGSGIAARPALVRAFAFAGLDSGFRFSFIPDFRFALPGVFVGGGVVRTE